MMKTIKFRKNLSDMILAGDKTTTWRLFDDKDLAEGDEVSFVVWETGGEFSRARLTHIHEKKLGDLDAQDWEGHERFPSTENMYHTFEIYYGQVVSGETIVKIIHFMLL